MVTFLGVVVVTVVLGLGGGGTTGFGGGVVTVVEGLVVDVVPKLGGASSLVVPASVPESSSKEKLIEGGASAAKTASIDAKDINAMLIKRATNFDRKFLFLDIFLFSVHNIIAKNMAKINPYTYFLCTPIFLVSLFQLRFPHSLEHFHILYLV